MNDRVSPDVLRLAEVLSSTLTNQAVSAPIVVMNTARYVTIEWAHIRTGYSIAAIEKKIYDGVWVEGSEWIKAPDGRVLIDMEGYESWAEKGRASKSAKKASASISFLRVPKKKP